jgi:HD-like signal output (HDOD) protein
MATRAAATRSESYGRGVVEIGGYVDAETVRECLMRKFSSPAYRPPVLPRVALELHKLSRSSNVDIRRVAALAESEPILCAGVIRRAQSAFYANGGERVQSVHQAIVRLGLDTVSNLFLEVAMGARLFRAPGFEGPMEQLRLHSVATAHAAARIARRTAIFEDFAFLSGLLHDMGLAAAMISLAEMSPKNPPAFSEVWPALLAVHEEATRTLCDLWKLPPDLSLVLSKHHYAMMNGMIHPLSAILAIAEWEVAQLGFSIGEESRDPVWAREALGLESQEESIRAEITLAVTGVA